MAKDKSEKLWRQNLQGINRNRRQVARRGGSAEMPWQEEVGVQKCPVLVCNIENNLTVINPA